MAMLKRSLAITGLLALAGCNQPRPEGVAGCSNDYYYFDQAEIDRLLPTQPPDYFARRFGGDAHAPDLYQELATAIRAMPDGAAGEVRYLHILVLSGGGQWGAYGAGFMKGWRAADNATGGAWRDAQEVLYPAQRRSDIDIVAGISTGAAQTPAAYVGAVADPELAAEADNRLADQYLAVTQDELIRARFGGEAAVLFSNSLYTVDGLEKRANELVGAYYEAIRARPAWKRLYVGTVNLDRNRFTVVDLKAMVDRSPRPATKQSIDCLAQSLLASAAVPLAFPPRFVDGYMYVDGNVRHGVFAAILFRQEEVRKAMRDKNIVPYVSVIINGNLSADSYHTAAPKPVENGGVAIATTAVSNMLDQVNKDSTYQIENDLIALFGVNSPSNRRYWSRYAYVDNKAIQKARDQLGYEECSQAVAATSDLVFDPVFMKCLYKIGVDEGRRQAWRSFYQIPQPRISRPGPQL
jgi:predicted acylesterase/phospholipase RssA